MVVITAVIYLLVLIGLIALFIIGHQWYILLMAGIWIAISIMLFSQGWDEEDWW